MKFRKVLFATDLSAHSEQTIRYAKDVIEGETDITLLTVVTDPFVPMGPDFAPSSALVKEFREQLVQQSAASLNEICMRQLNNRCNLKEVLPSSQSPAQAVCTYAKENSHDLIVIGSHGAGRLSSLFLGTTAQRILKLAPCPVLVITDKTVENAKESHGVPRSVLIGTDMSQPSLKMLEAAGKFLSADSRIELLTVLYSAGLGEWSGEFIKSATPLLDYLQQRLPKTEERLKEIASKYFPSRVVNTRVIESVQNPGEVLCEYGASIETDMIVMGSQGAGVLANLFIGSTVQNVVKMAASPVLVVPMTT